MSSDHQSPNLIPKLYLYDETRYLFSSIASKLKNQNLKFVLVTSNKKSDEDVDSNIEVVDLNNISFDDRLIDFNYFIVFLDNFDKKLISNKTKDLEKIIKIVSGTKQKILFVMPYKQANYLHEFFERWKGVVFNQKGVYVGIVYYGELVEIPVFSLSLLFDKTTLIKSSNQSFNPVSLIAITDFVIYSLFSLKAKHSSALLGNAQPIESVVQTLIYLNPRIKTKTRSLYVQTPSQIDEYRFLEVDLLRLLSISAWNILKVSGSSMGLNLVGFLRKLLTLIFGLVGNSFRLLRVLVVSLIPKKTNSHPSFTGVFANKPLRRYEIMFQSKFVKLTFLSLLTFFVLPFILFYFSHRVLLLSDLNLRNKNLIFGKSLSLTANRVSDVAQKYTNFFIRNNLNFSYLTLNNRLRFVNKKSAINLKHIDVLEKLAGLHPSRGESQNPIEKIEDIALDIESIYSEIGFLESEFKDDANQIDFRGTLFSGDLPTETKTKTLLFSKLLKQSGDLLGKDRPVKYILLLQDNNILRATGGKILALSVVTISEGKIVDSIFLDTKYADSRLIGEVEPPMPLFKYFQNSKWYLEESNWYSDFPSSAEKVEWFLDKELDIQADGVLAINIEALNTLSESFNFNMGLINAASENDVDYPLLLKSLIDNLISLESKQRIKLTPRLIDLFSNKQLILFTHNKDANYYLNDIGWDGSVKKLTCLASKCTSDLVGMVETTHNAKDVNLEREMELKLSFEEKLIKKEILLFLKNKNNSLYASYIRFLLDANSGVSPATIITDNVKTERTLEVTGQKGHKEAGLYVSLNPGQSMVVNLYTEISVSEKENLNNYNLLIRSQPGMKPMPIKVVVSGVDVTKINSQPLHSLTDEGTLLYNTKLLRDLYINLTQAD